MWSDKDIDNAFQRLNPPETEPAAFPLDAWLRLETQLDKAVIERAVRRKLWRFFAAEVAVVALVALSWLLWWPAGTVAASKELAGELASAAPTKQQAATAPISGGPAASGRAAAGRPASEAAAAPAISARPSVSPQASVATLAQRAAEPSLAAKPASPALPKAPGLAARHRAGLAAVAAVAHKARPGRLPAEGRASHVALKSSYATASASRKGKAVRYAKADNANATIESSGLKKAVSTAASTASRGWAAPAANLAPSSSTAFLSRKTDRRNRELVLRPGASSAVALHSGMAAIPSLSAADNSSSASPSRSGAADNAALAFAEPALLLPETAAVPTPLAPVAVAEPTQAEVPAAARQPRFYVGLVGAPDVTTVKFASVESPLPNVGITLEYHLTSRLRLNTGLLRSTKQYTANRDDYDWGAYQTLVYQHNFEYVDGTCTVLDVPLNLRYDLVVRPQARIFGSVGLSSFFMQREKYSYAWVDHNMPYLWQREVVNENRHLLSILNLSAGYERSLSPRWSLQAEPYLKLPLGGVGMGKVRLTSAGIFLGIRYGF